MSAGLEERFEEIVRRVVREEFARHGNTDDIDLLTADQVTELLGFKNRDSVYKLKREGKLRAFNLGGKNGNSLRFSKAEVRKFLEEHAA